MAYLLFHCRTQFYLLLLERINVQGCRLVLPERILMTAEPLISSLLLLLRLLPPSVPLRSKLILLLLIVLAGFNTTTDKEAYQ